MGNPDWTDLKAIIVDPQGPELTAAERALFAREKPAGFILFQRNCVSKEQIRRLVTDLRDTVGRDDIPVLIDQEGGSVARLRAPQFQEYAPAKIFGELYGASTVDGLRAAEINAFLMARDLADLGITVNCAPVADVPSPECHVFLSGSRTYSDDAQAVSDLSAAVCRGLLAGGVTPVMKHIPGHGRAQVDSHHGLPMVDADRKALETVDFVPFRQLSAGPLHHAIWAMAAHVVYSALDPDSAATVSPAITRDIVRGDIGFDGVLIADDISMKALGGDLAGNVKATLAAGMDLTMLCHGSLEDHAAALAACPQVTPAAAARLARAEEKRRALLKAHNDNAALADELAGLLKKTGQA